jgi:hypothetical protein
MSHHTTLIAAAIETARDFGIDDEKLEAFETRLLEKISAAPEIRFTYTPEFLKSLSGRYVTPPTNLPTGEWTMSEAEARMRDASPDTDVGFTKVTRRGIRATRSKKSSKNVNSKSYPPIKRGENAWIPSVAGGAASAADDAAVRAAALKSINSDLNKLTDANFDTISKRVVDNLTEEIIPDFAPIMFDKAVWDDKYRKMYARLCVMIQDKIESLRRPLIMQCQIEFNKPIPEVESDSPSAESAAEHKYAVIKWKKRRLGTIHFIVELLKVRIVHPKVVIACLYGLLGHETTEPIGDDVFHAAELLVITKGVLPSKFITPPVARLGEFLEAGKLKTREKFKVQDTLKLYGVTA